MATKTVVTLVDDLTGEEGEGIETIGFGLDGAQYEIDLDEKNAEELRTVLAAYVQNGRRTGGRSTRGKTRPAAAAAPAARPAARKSPPRSREESKAIRDWAAKQDIKVAVRGRIPDEVVARYDEAHRS